MKLERNGMGVIHVGVGEYLASASPGDVLKTIGLGSCLAVVFLAPKSRAVGLIHVALPASSVNPKRAESKPGTFADSGIPALHAEMRRFGGNSPNDLVIKLVGGATIADDLQIFNIGKRNVLAAKKILWELEMAAIAEDTGGRISRSVNVEVDTGRVIVASPGRGSWEI